jgi:hypothetical protein
MIVRNIGGTTSTGDTIFTENSKTLANNSNHKSHINLKILCYIFNALVKKDAVLLTFIRKKRINLLKPSGNFTYHQL